ncbi:splicing factor 45 [Lichtheimia corymbifera JMRC:FSU:9682]|uniref:Splicing factor 45 n=1 Tax=Lichtheimia corymbifera JMRC:FSU:9682 TaxID=1263082 RepID=A0A068RHD8_9FUNG|nr:splicing factor 45 [Lichtheimia corymbifera JMRC:FSU:9682]
MPFSLYGDLPEPSSDKSNNVKNTPTTTGSSLSGLYASLPAPGASSSATAATTTTTNTPPTTTTANTTPSPTISTTTTAASQTAAETNNNAPTSSPAPTTGVKPAGWSSFGHFRPVMRKPTIQAKPKLNRAVIPAGAKVVSTTTVSKDPSKMEQDAATASTLPLPPPPPPSSSNPIEDTIPSLPRRLDASYFTATDDVNGFRAKKKGKGKKGNQQQQQQPIAIDLNEDYDPLRPNDYEQYKEDRRQHKEEVKRRQMEERRNRQRQRSMSPYSSDSRSRSRSRSPSPRRPARVFAPPPNLYQRSNSPSPPPASRRSRSPSPPPERIQPKANIDLNESADDAYMRRLRMSSQRAAVAQHQEEDSRNERMPMDEDDEDMAMRPGLGGAQDVARKVMAKYGWQEGQGLGRDEDGLREALKVQPTGRGSGVIVNQSHISSVSPSPPPPALQPRTSTPSPVVLLTNMVGPGQVDDMLQEETADECGKYGQVERCLIFEVPGGQVPEDQAVRIFVKFTRVESAMAALNDLNGRFFGGRVVTARFFDNNRFDRLDLAPGPNEI